MNYNPVNKLECYYGSIRIMLAERKKNKNKIKRVKKVEKSRVFKKKSRKEKSK